MNGHAADGPYYFKRRLCTWCGWRYRYTILYGAPQPAMSHVSWMLVLRRELRRRL